MKFKHTIVRGLVESPSVTGETFYTANEATYRVIKVNDKAQNFNMPDVKTEKSKYLQKNFTITYLEYSKCVRITQEKLKYNGLKIILSFENVTHYIRNCKKKLTFYLNINLKITLHLN